MPYLLSELAAAYQNVGISCPLPAPRTFYVSPAAHLLVKNDFSSIHDQEVIATAILEIEDHIISIEDGIEQLYHQRETLLRYRRLHISLGAPIHRCPPEILSEIFRFSLPHYKTPEWNVGHWKAPMELSQVCSHWRVTAYSTPGLFSQVSLQSSMSVWSPYLSTQKSFQDWLNRSGGGPMHVTMANLASVGTPILRLVEFFYTSKRWKTLDCFLDSSRFPKNLDWGSLEYLMLRLGSNRLSVDPSGPFGFKAFEKASRLRYLCLQSARLMSSTTKLPWAQIQALQVFEHCSSNFAPFLPQMKSLLSLVLNMEDYSYPYGSSSSEHQFSHAHLRDLFICANFPSSCRIFFERISFPSLETLCLYGYAGNSGGHDWTKRASLPKDSLSLMSFLRRSGSHMHTLILVRFSEWTVDTEGIPEILRELPTLAVLKTDGCIFTPDVLLSLLNVHERVPPLCPVLQDLVLFETESDLQTHQDNIHWLRPRFTWLGPWKLIPMVQSRLSFNATISGVIPLRRLGLNLDILFNPEGLEQEEQILQLRTLVTVYNAPPMEESTWWQPVAEAGLGFASEM